RLSVEIALPFSRSHLHGPLHESPGVHVDRTPRRYRHHCGPYRVVVTRRSKSSLRRGPYAMSESDETNGLGSPTLPRFQSKLPPWLHRHSELSGYDAWLGMGRVHSSVHRTGIALPVSGF